MFGQGSCSVTNVHEKDCLYVHLLPVPVGLEADWNTILF